MFRLGEIRSRTGRSRGHGSGEKSDLGRREQSRGEHGATELIAASRSAVSGRDLRFRRPPFVDLYREQRFIAKLLCHKRDVPTRRDQRASLAALMGHAALRLRNAKRGAHRNLRKASLASRGISQPHRQGRRQVIAAQQEEVSREPGPALARGWELRTALVPAQERVRLLRVAWRDLSRAAA